MSSRKTGVQGPDGREIFGLSCGEKRMHPPTEDCTDCGMCQEWIHKASTDNSGLGDSYKCDFCKNG